MCCVSTARFPQHRTQAGKRKNKKNVMRDAPLAPPRLPQNAAAQMNSKDKKQKRGGSVWKQDKAEGAQHRHGNTRIRRTTPACVHACVLAPTRTRAHVDSFSALGGNPPQDTIQYQRRQLPVPGPVRALHGHIRPLPPTLK